MRAQMGLPVGGGTEDGAPRKKVVYGKRERKEWLFDHGAQLCSVCTQLFWTGPSAYWGLDVI